MEESGIELRQILDEERLADTPLLIMANKSDLMNALEANEVSEELELKSIRDRRWHIQGCSAKTGDGLQVCWCIGPA